MKKVLLLLAEGFEIYEASAFIDVFGWNKLEGDGSTTLFTCGHTQRVKSTFDQQFVVDYCIHEVSVKDFDALAIPGGFEQYGFYDSAFHPDFQQLIKQFHEEGKPIASICTGAIPIAYSGLLNGKAATTYNNPNRMGMLKEYGATVSMERLVKTDNIVTSQNPSTALEVAYSLLETLTDTTNCNNVKHLMGFTV